MQGSLRICKHNGDTRFGQSIIMTFRLCAHIGLKIFRNRTTREDQGLREVQVSPVAFRIYQHLCNKGTSVTLILIHYLSALRSLFHPEVVSLLCGPGVSITWILLFIAILRIEFVFVCFVIYPRPKYLSQVHQQNAIMGYLPFCHPEKDDQDVSNEEKWGPK